MVLSLVEEKPAHNAKNEWRERSESVFIVNNQVNKIWRKGENWQQCKMPERDHVR